jgi:Holliday junction DNA helicase RuvA
MIGRLRGLLAAKTTSHVMLDVGGIGYEVAVSPRALVELPAVGQDAVLHTHTHVREDQLALFGFADSDQRDLFRILLGVSGVGPKVALAMLGTMTPEQLRRAVVAEDVAALTSVPGIGKRSAQKIMLELRPKLELPDAAIFGGGSPLGDVREALEGLGYQAAEIRDVLADLPDDAPVEELLRLSLRALDRQGA